MQQCGICGLESLHRGLKGQDNLDRLPIDHRTHTTIQSHSQLESLQSLQSTQTGMFSDYGIHCFTPIWTRCQKIRNVFQSLKTPWCLLESSQPGERRWRPTTAERQQTAVGRPRQGQLCLLPVNPRTDLISGVDAAESMRVIGLRTLALSKVHHSSWHGRLWRGAFSFCLGTVQHHMYKCVYIYIIFTFAEVNSSKTKLLAVVCLCAGPGRSSPDIKIIGFMTSLSLAAKDQSYLLRAVSQEPFWIYDPCKFSCDIPQVNLSYLSQALPSNRCRSEGVASRTRYMKSLHKTCRVFNTLCGCLFIADLYKQSSDIFAIMEMIFLPFFYHRQLINEQRCLAAVESVWTCDLDDAANLMSRCSVKSPTELCFLAELLSHH